MTSFRYFGLALILALVGWGVTWDLWFRKDLQARSVPILQSRDSISNSHKLDVDRYDTFVQGVIHFQSDTLAAILRDRARRPPIRINHIDTIHDTMTMADDKGSSKLCEVAISCSEARNLIFRDSALLILADSLRGEVAISKAEIDSVEVSCRPKTNWNAMGIPFGAGLVSGLAACILLN